MSRRRAALAGAHEQPHTHAGLWLDRYIDIEKAEDRSKAHAPHLQTLIDHIRVPESYPGFFRRWRSAIKTLPPHTATAEAEVVGRMVVGLGAESVLETAVALHRTYGVPYIPGSALKGLAAATAHRWLEDAESWRKEGKNREIGTACQEMFGDQTLEGCVTFHDALWIPGPNETKLPLDLDVMTVHHADYYGGQDKPPADWDSPNPVVFLTARGKYLLAVTGPEDWAGAALKILAKGLLRNGIGAKTAAGYGRMKTGFSDSDLGEEPASVPGTLPGEGRPSSSPHGIGWPQKVALIGIHNAAQEVIKLLDSLPPEERKPAAMEIIKKIDRRKVRDKAAEGKDWALRLQAEISG